jgi:hypothetical protein
MDPDVVVLQLAYSGGLRAEPPEGFEPSPRLRVFADGRVITGQNRPDQVVHEIRLGEEQLLAELAKVVERERFFELDQAALSTAIAETGRRIMLADGVRSRIAVRLDDRAHEVEMYAVRFCADEYPEVAGLQQLCRIELACLRLAALAAVGGPERLQFCLTHVQENIDAAGGQWRITADHLSGATDLPDGGMQVRFAIPANSGESGVIAGCSVEVELDAEGQPRSTSIFPDQAQPEPARQW